MFFADFAFSISSGVNLFSIKISLFKDVYFMLTGLLQSHSPFS